MKSVFSTSQAFLHWYRGYLKLAFGLLILMTGARLSWFFTYRRGDELDHFFADLIHAFVLGFRFDLSAVLYLSSLSLILWLPWFLFGRLSLYKNYLILQRTLWILILLFLLFILVADYSFYGYFQDHFNAMVFGLFQDDTSAILKTVWKNYPVIKILISTLVLISALRIILPKLWTEAFGQHEPASPWLRRASIFFIYFLTAIGARGTLGLFPLEIMHTAISSNTFINTLSFNGFHALARSIQLYDQQHLRWDGNLKNLGYQSNPLTALTDFSQFTTSKIDLKSLLPIRRVTSLQTEPPRPHVVVILMESWGSDWMKYDNPNFNLLGDFKKHQVTDYFTPHLLPSNVATIGSLGSLVVDLPHRVFSPFLTESTYLGVEFETAPARQFFRHGYQTHFIYGGNLGWRSIDKFLPKQGFQFLHGENELLNYARQTGDLDLTHDWGVYDEYVFAYASDLLQKATSPQFLFILTTSNHPPYTIPSHYSPLRVDFTDSILQLFTGEVSLAKDRLKVYQYANQQLGQFLTQIKNSELRNHTVIAATGDHSFYIRPYDNLQLLEKWSVPFYLYLPPSISPKSDRTLPIGSHIDIFPTLYNRLFAQSEYFSLGNDLLDSKSQPWAFHTPSMSSFSNKFGTILTPSGQILNSLCKSTNGEFETCPLNQDHLNLQKRFNSIMGTADLIFETQNRKQSIERLGLNKNE